MFTPHATQAFGLHTAAFDYPLPTNGGYFIIEAIIPPGSGPPLHIHYREEKSFYLLAGILDITLGKKKLATTAGDFVQLPRGTVRAFRNSGITTARMLLFFSPAGMNKYFEEVFEQVADRAADIPPVTDKLITRMVAAGPKHGIEFV